MLNVSFAVKKGWKNEEGFGSFKSVISFPNSRD